MKAVRTLVLVANEGEARVLENTGTGRGLAEICAMRADDFPELALDISEAPGRQNAAPGQGGHALDPRETEREARRTGFSRLVIEALEQVWRKKRHDRIIVAAAPRLLGELRQRMPKDVAAAVVADLPKDLVKITVRDLPAHFASIAAF